MSGEIPDVIGGQTIAVAWGNPVKDRTVMRYQNVAERDSLLPTPVVGDVAFVEEFFEVAPTLFESALTIYGNVPVGSWNVVWQGTGSGPYLPVAGGTMTGQLIMEDRVAFEAGSLLMMNNTALLDTGDGGVAWQVMWDDSTGRFYRKLP